MSEITKRLLTDDTGQEIVDALEGLALAVKPTGDKIDMSSSDSTKISTAITSANQAIANVQNGLAYIVGNTNTTGSTLAVGQFVYVKGHSTIADGLRTVTASISANGNITTSNTSACSDGGLNALNSKIATDWKTITAELSSSESGATVHMLKFGKMRIISFQGVNRAHEEDEVLMTLQTEDRPIVGANVYSIGTIGTTPVIIAVNGVNGKVVIYLINGATSSARLYFSVSYVVA